jgi:hypothetical protein
VPWLSNVPGGAQRADLRFAGRAAALTLPFELQATLAYRRDLMSAVARIFADSVMGWDRRLVVPGVPGARGGVEARPPPYFRCVTRLGPTSQVELFE